MPPTRKQQDKPDGGGSKCGTCCKLVTEGENAVGCEICGTWYHCKCHDVSDSLHKAMIQHGAELHWFCRSCRQGAEKLLNIVAKLSNKVDRLEDEISRIGGDLRKDLAAGIEEVMKSFQKLNERVDNCELRIESCTVEATNHIKNCEDEMSKNKAAEMKWSEVVKSEVDSKFSELSSDLDRVQGQITQTKSAVDEQQDKASRLNNIIIFNVKEKFIDDKDEWYEGEKDNCLRLFNQAMRVDVQPDDIKRQFRIGKKPADENVKPRPILIEFKDGTLKNRVMESTYRLFKTEIDDYRGVYVVHDMTKQERQQCRDLAVRAREMQDADESGEWKYRVRGPPGSMRIVTLRK